MVSHLVWLVEYGHLPKKSISYKNKNEQDNRISNLVALSRLEIALRREDVVEARRLKAVKQQKVIKGNKK